MHSTKPPSPPKRIPRPAPCKAELGRQAESGSATIYAIALVALVGLIGAVLLAVGALSAAASRARAGADLGALAAASTLANGGGDHCAVASEVARVNGATLTACVTSGQRVRVTTTARSPTGQTAGATALAGPAGYAPG